MELLDKSLLQFLITTSKEKKINSKFLKEFQLKVLNSEVISKNANVENLIRELAYDLDYYEQDEKKRQEEPSFFGDEKAVELVIEAYNKLRQI
jgi:hypothetical protein